MEQQKQKCVATSAESKNTDERGAMANYAPAWNNSKGRYKTKGDKYNVKSYAKWRGMLYRCYSKLSVEKQPTYIGCTVCDEWLDFQNFAEWFHNHYPKDGKIYEIDKDIKVPLNKVYSPEACIFVDDKVNSFVIDSGATRGRYMIGVTLHKKKGKLSSRCRNPITGIRENLGYFSDEIEAHLAWRKRKSELAYELAMIQDRDEVKQALLNWKEALDNNLIHPY
jgi:hypothetical protein